MSKCKDGNAAGGPQRVDETRDYWLHAHRGVRVEVREGYVVVTEFEEVHDVE